MPRQDTHARESQADWGLWMAQAQSGDRDALSRLLSGLQPLLLRLALRRLRNGDDALDAVQEAMLKVCRAVATFDPARGAVAPWAERICHNECVNILRRRKPSPLPTGDDLDAGDAEPGDQAAEGELRGRVRQAVEALPAGERAAVRSRFLAGKSFREASEESGVPIATLASRTYRGLQSLRERLGPLAGGAV